MSYINRRKYERGAVSLFIVVFTALLIVVVTVSFVQLMIRNQQQATQSDLAQSAYDSALAGVEDAKRALVLNKKCDSGSVDAVLCTKIKTALASNSCDTLNQIFGTGGSGETNIQQDENNTKLDQAYTCVKILTNTPNYQRKGLSSGKSHVIPLYSPPGQAFNKVEIKWFTREDANLNTGGDEAGNTPISFPKVAFPLLPADTNDSNGWGQATPPLLRAQLMQTGSSFSLSDFDDAGGSESNANTLFLYPGLAGGDYSFASDTRQSGISGQPKAVRCDADEFNNGGYACSTILGLPSPKNTPDLANRVAFLRLSAVYTATRYQVTLKQNDEVISFYNVQPEVDSTGRASDMFRRVKARIQFEGAFPYPESAVDLDGSFCKDFWLTSDTAHFAPGRCDPARSVAP